MTVKIANPPPPKPPNAPNNMAPEQDDRRSRHGHDQSKKKSVLSLDDFAHRKGANRALQSFRERQATERDATARQMRSYRKVLKKEGYSPQNSSDRKRKVEHGAKDAATKRKKGEFYTAEKQEEYRSTKKETRKAEADERDRQKQQALRQRRKRSRLLTARTKRGQPIMKNVVQDILEKLQSESAST